MWALQRGKSLKRRLKKFEKKHRNEVKAIFDNLDTYMVSLNQGVKPMQLFQHRFVHNESNGIHAIDQTPVKKGALALRLYVYPDEETQTVFVLTLGDKSSQSRDVQVCLQIVRDLRKGREGEQKKKKDSNDTESQNDDKVDDHFELDSDE